MKKTFLSGLVLFFGTVGYTQDQIIGGWVPHEGNTIVEVYQSESGDYAGKIVWLEKPTNEKGEPYRDKNNPDKQLRNRTIMGMNMLEDLVYSNGKWEGTLYSPKKGRTVNAVLSLNQDNQLDVRVSFRGFSRTFTWTRTDLPK